MSTPIRLSPYSISFVIPTYNEEENIGDVIRDIQGFVKCRFRSHEIIVVDDGSSDRTGLVVATLRRYDPKIRLIRHSRNQGLGAALRSGVAKAAKQLICYIDSDRQFDIHDVNTFLRYIPRYDIVAGVRVHRQDPAMRLWIGEVYNALIRSLFHVHVRDVDCGFKLYKRDMFNAFPLHARTGVIDAEIIIKALRRGYRIKQVGVVHFPRRKGRSKYEMGYGNTFLPIIKPQVILSTLKEIFALWYELYRNF